eukprot:1179465-Prorocentrum_minimum.AAC.15
MWGCRNCMGKPKARKVTSRWEVGSRQGEVGLAESALPAREPTKYSLTATHNKTQTAYHKEPTLKTTRMFHISPITR